MKLHQNVKKLKVPAIAKSKKVRYPIATSKGKGPLLQKISKKINPNAYNGALFIGLNGISVKAHGNSNEKSFYYAIENTVKLINGNINSKIIKLLTEMENSGD